MTARPGITSGLQTLLIGLMVGAAVGFMWREVAGLLF